MATFASLFGKTGIEWTRKVGNYKQIVSGRGNNIWIIDDAGVISCGLNSYKQYTLKAGAAQISVAADGAVAAVDNANGVHLFENDGWKRLTSITAKQIALQSSSIMFFVNEEGILQRYNITNDAVDKRDYGVVDFVTAASDGTLWGLVNDQVLRWNGFCWDLINGQKMKHLSVGSALLVVGINQDDEIFQFVKSSWLQIAGKLRNITVTIDGILYVCDKREDANTQVGMIQGYTNARDDSKE
ncbi:6238_t:CDS:2 [Paraglomus occultum]|uniref:6238_t:CDS:1 n=1 Tax=Paraglomus occultum TaxID=144539 RepID=A0A9N9FBA9_9GLOM|nr:6238_t:CDS:2 [Paraglomus occultum]